MTDTTAPQTTPIGYDEMFPSGFGTAPRRSRRGLGLAAVAAGLVAIVVGSLILFGRGDLPTIEERYAPEPAASQTDETDAFPIDSDVLETFESGAVPAFGPVPVPGASQSDTPAPSDSSDTPSASGSSSDDSDGYSYAGYRRDRNRARTLSARIR
jgi:hypothetical protein